ncbi:MAG: hypothetical protein MJZ18_01815 [Bacteroidales bacterium]|nr:hypothetical protein [Bacteroidales bacterium]
MDYKELINNICTEYKYSYSFPYTYKRGEDFYEYVCKTIDEYIIALNSLDDQSLQELNGGDTIQRFWSEYNKDTNLFKDVQTIARAVKDALSKYINGYTFGAYSLINDLFFPCEIIEGKKDEDSYYYAILPRLTTNVDEIFYRVRKDSHCVTDGDYGQMYHVPFNLRHNVKTLRYNREGYPVLYLSNSLTDAIRESRANEGEFVYTKYKASSNLCVLTIGAIPPNACNRPIEAYSLLAFMPLIIACSVKVSNEENNFKPEYILPQLITDLVHTKKNGERIDGVVFVPAGTVLSNDYKRNFALTVDKNEYKYDKDLASKFEVTKPLFFTDDDKRAMSNKGLTYSSPADVEKYLSQRDQNEQFSPLDQVI